MTATRIENAQIEDPREHTIKAFAAAFKMDRDELAGPRVTAEATEQHLGGQLDRIEAKLDELLTISGKAT